MKLIAQDQINISAVSSETLRPGETFEVSDEHGEQLLARHPDKVVQVAEDVASGPVPDEAVPASNGDQPAPKSRGRARNKKAADPANKSQG